MLQINTIRENPQEVIDRLLIKNFDAKEIVEKVISFDIERRECQKNLDENLAEANSIAKQIGNLFKSGKHSEAGVLKERSAELKTLA